MQDGMAVGVRKKFWVTLDVGDHNRCLLKAADRSMREARARLLLDVDWTASGLKKTL